MGQLEMYEKLGDYTVLDRLGRGGTAVVYRARHDELGHVAIKLLPGVSRGARGRLLREAATAAALDHPRIIKVYGLGEHRQRPYIVMELLEGITLKTMMRSRIEASLEERLDLMKQVLEAVAHAHEAGVMHRDIKPQNIFVTHDGTIRVLDFGLARAEEDSTGKRERRGLVGTPAYMPPEQVDGGASDQRGDIFSAGTVFYELLSGARAFGGGRVPEILDRVTNHDPLPIHEVDDRMPEELSTIVRTAMAKDPEERYQSVSELLDAINDFESALAGWRNDMRDAISARLALLGPIPPGDPWPPDLQIPTRLPQTYFELLALRQHMDEHRAAFDELVEGMAWVERTLDEPLEDLDDDTLRSIANRADALRGAWPGEQRCSELGRRVLKELRARLPQREPVSWGNAGNRPSKEALRRDGLIE